MPQEVNNEPNW